MKLNKNDIVMVSSKSQLISDLRKKAEEMLEHNPLILDKLSFEDVDKLLNELQVHQIELELQNEELLLAQKQLEASRDNYSKLFNNAPVGYVALDENGMILRANSTFSDMMESDLSEFTERPFFNYILEDDRDIFIARYKAFFKKPLNKTAELRLKSKTRTFYVKLDGRTVQDFLIFKGNVVPHLLLTISDIDDKKKYENQLFFQAQLLNSVQQSVIATDIDGRIIFWNKYAEDLYKWTADEAISKHILNVTPTKATQKQAEEILKKLSSGESWSGEFEVQDKYNRNFPVKIYDYPIKDENNNLIGIIGVSYDISEQKKSQKLMQDYLQTIKNIVERVPSGLLIFNVTDEGSFQLFNMNPEAERLLDKKMEDCLNTEITDILPHYISDGIIPELTNVLTHSRTYETEKSYYDYGKLEKSLKLKAFEMPDKRLGLFLEDMTNLKSAEDNLKTALLNTMKREKEVKAFFDASRSVLEFDDFEKTARVIFDTACKLIGAVSGYVALLSDTGEENEVLFLESGGLPCTVNPELPMPIRGLREQAYITGEVVYDNNFMGSESGKLMPEGYVKLYNVLFSPLNIKGKTVGIIGLANKPSGFTTNDAKLAEGFGELAAIALTKSRNREMLINSEEKIRLLLDNAEDLIYIKDRDLKYTLVNNSMCETIGINKEDFIGKSAVDVFGEKHAEQSRENELKVLEGETVHEELFFDTKSVTKIFQIIKIPLKNSQSEITGLYGIARDITARKLSELATSELNTKLEEIVVERTKQLEEANIKLAKALEDEVLLSNLKDRFISTISHEYKTPLTVIQTSIDLLERSKEKMDEDKLMKHTRKIQTSIDRMIKLLDDVLLLKRLKEDWQTKIQKVDIIKIVNEVISVLESILKTEINIKVNNNLDNELIATDKNLITKILYNLIDNACKYSPVGKAIQLQISKAEKELLIQVKDEGYGILENEKRMLFEPFMRGERFLDSVKGIGLGLPIVLKSVNTLKGTLDFESKENQGTVFKVKIPIE